MNDTFPGINNHFTLTEWIHLMQLQTQWWR